VTARERRRVVEKVQAATGVSQRRAVRFTGCARSTIRYQSVRAPQEGLRARIRELAAERPRWGYRTIHNLLRREGRPVNRKRVQRLYREEGLAVRRRGKRRRSQIPRLIREPLGGANERWSMDFMSDTLSSGRTFRCLTIVDEFSRECLGIHVAHSIPAVRVIEVLEALREERGLAPIIVTDNGSEFTSRAFDSWAYARGIKIDYIQPGKPVQNCFIESFNGTLRDECLNLHWFLSLEDARRTIESWRKDYNGLRPHSSLGGLTPAEYAGNHSPSEECLAAISSSEVPQ
jgi:putative transposase